MSGANGSSEVPKRPSTTKYAGWAKLQPLTGEEGADTVLVPFTFPLDHENRYQIATKKEESVDLFLPDAESENEADRQPVEASLIVTKDGEVFLSRAGGLNTVVAVNGEAIDAGTTWRVPIAYGDTLSFGEWQYVLKKCKDLFGEEWVNELPQIDSCHVCSMQNRQGNLRVMACGHNICKACCVRARSLAFAGRRNTGRQNMGQQHGVAAANQAEPVAIRVQEPAPPHCVTCRSQVTAGVASTAIASLSTAAAAKVLADTKELAACRPVCSDCENKRGLFVSRDYNYCQRCKRLSCPPCALQWHRNHEFRNRIDHLRELDGVAYKLDSAKRLLEDLERMKRIAYENDENRQIANGHDSRAKAMNKALHLLLQKVSSCRDNLVFMQQRKRPMTCGWDETSQDLMAEFDQYVAEFKQVQQRIDGLKKGTVSVTVASDSSEEEGDAPSYLVE